MTAKTGTAEKADESSEDEDDDGTQGSKAMTNKEKDA